MYGANSQAVHAPNSNSSPLLSLPSSPLHNASILCNNSLKALPLTPGRRIAMSECDCESSRDFKFTGFDTVKGFESSSGTASIVERSKKESFSVSKIWLRGKQEKPQAMADSSSRRVVSLRFSAATEDLKEKNEKWKIDDENQSCYSVDSQGRAPSFARRTLL